MREVQPALPPGSSRTSSRARAERSRRRRRPGLGGAARAAVLAVAALVAAPSAGQRAREGGGLEVSTLVEKLQSGPDGAGALPVALPPAAVPQPGDALVYTVKFKNSGAGLVDGV